MNKRFTEILGDHIYLASNFLAIFVWSSSIVVTKLAYTTFPPLTLGAARSILAALILGVILAARKELRKPEPADFGFIFLSGALGVTAYFALQNIGVNFTTASDAALIVACYPVIVTMLELIIYKIKPSRNKVLGIIIAIAGIYILFRSSGETADNYRIVGNVILIAAGFAWAFYNFIASKVVKKYSAVTLSFYQFVAGSILFIPLTLIEIKDWQPPTLMSFSMLLYLSVFCSVAGFLLYNFGLRKLSASASIIMTNLMPIFGVIFSVLILHESVLLRQLIGGLIVIAGVFLSVRQGKSDSAV